jgi:putative transferase (TIGR04331 family)
MLKKLEERFFERVIEANGAGEADGIWLGGDDPPRGRSLVAGWWCSPNQRPGVLVLPNPWDDRDAIAEMEVVSREVSASLIQKLAPRLGDLHGLPPDVEYWSFILGQLMSLLASGTVDRLLYLRAAEMIAPSASAMIVPVADPPATMADVIWTLARTQRGNAELLSAVALALGVAVKIGDAPPTASDAGAMAELASPRSVRAILRHPRESMPLVLEAVARPVVTTLCARNSSDEDIVMVGGLRFGLADQARLSLRVPGVRFVSSPALDSLPASNAAQRAVLFDGIEADDELERALISSLAQAVPRSVVEGFSTVQTLSRAAYGSAACVVAGGYGLDEIQNEFIARSRQAGKGLAFAQHGGTYCQAKVHSSEYLEVLRPDSEFWSWGGKEDGVVPVTNPRLERLRGTHRGGETVLIVEGQHPPDEYVVAFGSVPLGNQLISEAFVLSRFVAGSQQTRHRMVFRRFPAGQRVGPRQSVFEDMPTASSSPYTSASRLMQSSRLVVIPYPDTPFIEALVIGVPTVGLWSKDLWEWRDDAADVLDALREANIVFDDPMAAAAHVDSVIDAPASWWSAPDVVRARGLFIERFARQGDWLAEWTEALGRLRAEGEQAACQT